MKKVKEKLPEYEVTVITELGYKITKVLTALNSYEAALKMADFLSGDFDYYYGNDDYSVSRVMLMVDDEIGG